jgi:predicted anti-sigma-YlaC factor YlaD
MKRIDGRHFTEEELLMHFLQEEVPAVGNEISAHLQQCSECSAICSEYGALVKRIQSWAVPQVTEEIWQDRKRIVLAQFREDLAAGKRKGILSALRNSLITGWNYALENPLPTLAYIAVGTAFAMERTITTFRLDQILPGASQVFEFLRQVF